MREIKFRAWEPDTKKMVDVFGVNPMVQKVYLSHQQLFGTGGDDLLLSYSPDEEYSYVRLMQYTGLKDRHGVEIYEGDILSGEFGKDTVELEEYHLDGGGTAICYVYSHSPLNQGLVDECDIEVIGNIYENRELLDGGKE